MGINAQAAFQIFEDFENLSRTNIHGQNGWFASPGSNQVVLDPADGTDQALQVWTESGRLFKGINVAAGTKRMLFLQLLFKEHGRYSFGLSPLTSPSEYSDFEPELGMAAATASDPENDLRVANPLSSIPSDEVYDVLTTAETLLVPDTWFNVWVLVDNSSGVYEVWLNSIPGGDAQASQQLENEVAETIFGFRLANGEDLINFYIKTGGGDSPPNGRFYLDNIYLEDTEEVNLSNPLGAEKTLSSGDLDGNGQYDVVVDFGSAIGLWAWMNDAVWLRLHNTHSPDGVAIADVDGNGEHDVIGDFSSTAGGLWTKRNLGAWLPLHPAGSEAMAGGDLDGNGQEDVVVDFGPEIGLWARMNDVGWLKLHPTLSPDLMAIADIDGNGEADVIADFSSTVGGLYAKRNLGTWLMLDPAGSEALAAGDLDGNGLDDVVVRLRATNGLLAWMNDATWLELHGSYSPEIIATGDLDGNGADDVLGVFGNTAGGLWAKRNLGAWQQENPNTPDDVVTGDMGDSGQDDIQADFSTAVGGVWVKQNETFWLELHQASPQEAQ
jgi:hypothetical protein